MNKFTQGSNEWLEMRRKMIGASDAPIILNISPYKTALELWEEKTGRRQPPPPSPWMTRGNELEFEVRARYEEQTGTAFLPYVVEHPEHDWMMASLDGLSFDKRIILEIKCCKAEVFNKARGGVVVPHYYAQIQHQLACCPEAEEAHYVCYHKDQLATVIVSRDHKYIEEMIQQEIEFYRCMTDDVPPAPSEKDYVWIDDPSFLSAAQQYLAAKEALDFAKKEEARWKAELLQHTDDGNCRGGGLKITRCKRETIDYKQACLDHHFDLDKYKRESSGYWKITKETK